MTILWSNNASTTVSGSITAVSTSVALAAGTGVLFPQPTGSDYFVATFYDQATKTQNEIVHVTSVTGDVATIVRAQEGTTAQAWNAGDIFANLVTAGTLRNFVQSGAGPASTSIVYVGTDTSITPSLIVCNTVPVPANYATGMLFNIKVNNTNTGPVQLQLNGTAAVAATRTDGSAMVGGNLIASEEMMFVYNGVNFTSMVPPIPQQPPQTTFYVRTDGNDNNSGFANTTAAAFATISGAMHQIKARYISQNVITLRVADGTYTDGFSERYSYIAGWNIIGDTTNPANCVINATNTSQGGYPSAYANPGTCVLSQATAQMWVSGFTFESYYTNVSADAGSLGVQTCYFTSPTAGYYCIASGEGGNLNVSGNCQYSGSSPCPAIFVCNGGGVLTLAQYSLLGVPSSNPLNFNIVGNPTITSCIASIFANGTFGISPYVVTFTGTVLNVPEYICNTGGGISHGTGSSTLPGSQPGQVTAPGWAA